MANVVKLETPVSKANSHTVELLERALTEAREGRIQECALAVVYSDHATGWRRSSSNSISSMIGSVSILLHKLHIETD